MDLKESIRDSSGEESIPAREEKTCPQLDRRWCYRLVRIWSNQTDFPQLNGRLFEEWETTFVGSTSELIADVLALDLSLVQHHVDTGTNPSVKQSGKRVPFV